MGNITNPHTQATLDAIKFLAQDALPNFTVDTEIPSLPYVDKTPALIVTEYRQIVARTFSGLRGNREGMPNLYSFVFLEAGAKTQKNKTISQIVKEFRTDLNAFIEAFKFDPTLQGTVMSAADTIEVHYDRYGPYLRYFGIPYVGCLGIIDIMELYRPNEGTA
jgi:hypothetical protein